MLLSPRGPSPQAANSGRCEFNVYSSFQIITSHLKGARLFIILGYLVAKLRILDKVVGFWFFLHSVSEAYFSTKKNMFIKVSCAETLSQKVIC